MNKLLDHPQRPFHILEGVRRQDCRHWASAPLTDRGKPGAAGAASTRSSLSYTAAPRRCAAAAPGSNAARPGTPSGPPTVGVGAGGRDGVGLAVMFHLQAVLDIAQKSNMPPTGPCTPPRSAGCSAPSAPAPPGLGCLEERQPPPLKPVGASAPQTRFPESRRARVSHCAPARLRARLPLRCAASWRRFPAARSR